MRRASVLARFCVKAGFFPQEEADNIHRQYDNSDDSGKLTFEAWAVARGFLSVAQARGVVEMLGNSRFRCLGCGAELFGRQFRVDGQKMFCPHCNSEEFRIQGAAGASTGGTQMIRATSKAPKAPGLPGGPGGDDGGLPDSFEDDNDDVFTTTGGDPFAASAATGGDFDTGFNSPGTGGFPTAPPPPPPAPAAAVPPPPPDEGFELTPQMLDRGLPEGAMLEGIRITRVVGRGGIGIVYKGIQEQLDREVALKVLSANVIKDQVQRSRFKLEAQSSAKLEHPNIVQVYTFGEKFGRPYLVMQWVDGESLGQKIDNQGALPVRDVVDWAAQTARGLHHAHQAGIVHRDVKPDNLIVATNGQLKIVDFGLAKQKTSDLNLSDPNFVLGTPAYIAPEQALGQPIDARTDVYSLAITLFHALTGDIPFDGPAGTVVHKHIQATLPSPRQRNPQIPPELDELVRRMAAKVPNQRPKDMEEVAIELEKIKAQLEGRGTAPVGTARNPGGGLTAVVDQVFDEDDDLGTDFVRKGPMPPVAATPVGGQSITEIENTVARGASATGMQFRPIEEIEYSSSNMPAPEAPAASAPVMDMPSPTAGLPAMPDLVPPPPPPPPPGAGGFRGTPLDGGSEDPRRTGELPAGGMKGRRGGDADASTGTATAPEPAPQPAPKVEGSPDDATQILGKDYAARVSAISTGIHKRRKKKRMVVIFTLLLMLAGAAAFVVITMPELFDPALAMLKKMDAEAQGLPDQSETDLKVIRERLDGFEASFPDRTGDKLYVEIDKRLQTEVDRRRQLLVTKEGEQHLEWLRAAARTIDKKRDDALKLIARPEEIDIRTNTKLTSILADVNSYQSQLKVVDDWVESNQRFKIPDGVDSYRTALRSRLEEFPDEVQAVRDAIGAYMENLKLRQAYLADEARLLDGWDPEHPEVNPPNFDLEEARLVLKALEDLRDTVLQFDEDARIAEAIERLRTVINIFEKDARITAFLDRMATLAPGEQQTELAKHLGEFDSDQDDSRMASFIRELETLVDNLDLEYDALMVAVDEVKGPADLDRVIAILGELRAFIPRAMEGHVSGAKAAIEKLEEIKTEGEAGRTAFKAIETEAEPKNIQSVGHADELLARVGDLVTRYPWLEKDARALIAKINAWKANSEEQKRLQADFDALIDKHRNAQNADEARAALRELESMLSNPKYAGFESQAEPWRKRWNALIAWESLADPPAFDGRPWQVRDITAESFEGVVGRYLASGHTAALRVIDTIENPATERRWLLTAGDDGVARIWNQTTGEELRAIRPSPEPGTRVVACYWESEDPGDNDQLILGYGNRVVPYSIARRTPGAPFIGNIAGDVLSMAITRDGKYLAVGSADRAVRIYETARGVFTDPFVYRHDGPVTSVRWASYGREPVLLSGGRGRELKSCNMLTKKVTTIGAADSPVDCLALSLDGKSAVTGHTDGECVLWDAERQERLASLKMPSDIDDPEPVTAVLIVGQVVFTATRGGSLHMWDIQTARRLRSFDSGIGTITTLSLHDQGGTVVAGSADGRMRPFTPAGQPANAAANGHVGRVRGVTVADDRVLTVSDDTTTRIWSRESGTLLKTVSINTRVTSAMIACHRIGNTDDALVVSATGRVGVVNLKTYAETRTFDTGIREGATCAAISPDDKMMVIGTATGAMAVVDILAGSRVHTMSGRHNGQSMSCVAISPNRQFAASASADGRVVVWELGRVKERFPPLAFGGPVHAMVFTADSKKLIVGGGTGSQAKALAYDVDSGREAMVYDVGGDRPVTAVGLVGTDNVMIARGDGQLQIRNITNGRLVDEPVDLVKSDAVTGSFDFATALHVTDTHIFVATARGVVLVFRR